MRAFLILSVLALSACDTLGDGPPSLDSVDPAGGFVVASLAELRDFQDAWRNADLEDYRLRYEVVCFCTPRVVDLRVEDGSITEAWINGEPVPDDPASAILTIDALYRVAERGFQEADGVTVRVLEGAAPLPISVFVDPSELIADEEVGYIITGFEAN